LEKELVEKEPISLALQTIVIVMRFRYAKVVHEPEESRAARRAVFRKAENSDHAQFAESKPQHLTRNLLFFDRSVRIIKKG